MKKRLIRSMAFLLIGMMLLMSVGCGVITQKLDSIFKTETDSPSDNLVDELEQSMPDRAKETYTLLILTECGEASVLDHAMLVSFNTSTPTISALQLPTDLYLHVAEQSVQGVFGKQYETSVKDGRTAKEAAADAAIAVKDILASGFHMPIDYYINFSAEQLSALINTLGGVELTVPFTMGSLKAGKQTLSGSQTIDFLGYDSFSNMPQTYMDARKLVTAAIYDKARESVESEMLSLFVMELRSEMTTNIPSSGGEDIFFVRKWLQTEPESFQISNVSTQVVYISSSSCRILVKSNTLKQMNELLKVYQEELTDAQFDPRYVFIDYSSDVAKAVYNSSAALPATYTAAQLTEGALVLKK